MENYFRNSMKQIVDTEIKPVVPFKFFTVKNKYNQLLLNFKTHASVAEAGQYAIVEVKQNDTLRSKNGSQRWMGCHYRTKNQELKIKSIYMNN
jgi:hypothetical protein